MQSMVQTMRKLIMWIIAIIVLVTTACGTDTTQTNSDSAESTEVTANSSVDESEDGEGKIGEILGPKDVIIKEIESLLNGEKETVVRYFGESDVYSGFDVRDRIAVCKINFIEEEIDTTQKVVVDTVENTDNEEVAKTVADPDAAAKKAEEEHNAGLKNGFKEVNVHICNIDYAKTNEVIAELTNRIKTENPDITEDEMNTKVINEVAARAQNGEFDVHVTMPVKVKYLDGKGSIELTEEFKTAITGGWFNPTNAKIVNGDCPVREEAQKKIENGEKAIEETESVEKLETKETDISR